MSEVLSVAFRIVNRPSIHNWSAFLNAFDVVQLLANSPGEAIVPLEITQREADGIYILSLRGRLVLGEESSGFRATVENLLSSGNTRLVINLEHASHIDSAGLGALIEAHRTTKAQGGRLKLSNLGPKFKEALQFARLLNIFHTYPTEAVAVESPWS
jgi:anti-sigma B factor antagonist